MALITTDEKFTQDVLNNEKPVLVDFWAPWCGPCLMLSPLLEEISEKLNGEALVYKLNVDENPQTAQKYGISSIPTVITFRDGEVNNKLIGLQQKQNYLDAINKRNMNKK